MKKLKLIAPILASVAVVAPVTTTLANCSCSNFDYTGITKMLKEDLLTYFTEISGPGCFRETWKCEGIFKKIIEIMTKLGYDYVARDNWSEVARKDWEEKGGKKGVVEGDYGNIWYDIPATQGWEHVQKVILTANYDMYYDCEEEQKEDIKANGIKLHTDDENQLLYTEGYKNTAGFNDGIGVALMLAFAKNQSKFAHGPVRLLFTADSMDSTPSYSGGALYLKESQEKLDVGLKPYDTPFVICTDGYRQADINVSSAGIHQCQFTRTLDPAEGECGEVNLTDPTLYGGKPYKFDVEVSGLTGGHSGIDMHKNLANAVKILFEFITLNSPGLRLVSFDTIDAEGYAIPTHAKATVVMGPIIDKTTGNDVTLARAEERKEAFIEAYENAYPVEKGKIKLELKPTQLSVSDTVYALSSKFTSNLCVFCNLARHGAFVWFDEKHTEPKTSANLSPVYVSRDSTSGKFTVSGSYTCRSANASQLEVFSSDAHKYLEALLETSKGTLVDVETPVWENTMESHKVENQLANLLTDAYKRFRYTPVQVNCHGCLEGVNHAAVIEDHYEGGIPYIATIGPTILNFQHKAETLRMSTLTSFIRVFLYVLQNAGSLKVK